MEKDLITFYRLLLSMEKFQLKKLKKFNETDGPFKIDRDTVNELIMKVMKRKNKIEQGFAPWLLKYNFWGSEQEERVTTSEYEVVESLANDALSYNGTDEVVVYRRYATIKKKNK